MTDETPSPTNVVAALSLVMRDLPGIAKAKHRTEDGKGLTYAYRGIEEITAEVQGLFAKYGVVTVPRVRARTVKDIVVNDRDWTDTYLEVEWDIYGPGGTLDFISATTYGHGRDNSDKGTNKAMTQAYKYLLLDLLAISDPADDNDGTNVEGTRKVKAGYDPSQPLFETVNGEQIPLTVLEGEVTRTGPGGVDASSITGPQAKKVYAMTKGAYGSECKVNEKVSELIGRPIRRTEEVQAHELDPLLASLKRAGSS